jgi:hypothetical protein
LRTRKGHAEAQRRKEVGGGLVWSFGFGVCVGFSLVGLGLLGDLLVLESVGLGGGGPRLALGGHGGRMLLLGCWWWRGSRWAEGKLWEVGWSGVAQSCVAQVRAGPCIVEANS